MPRRLTDISCNSDYSNSRWGGTNFILLHIQCFEHVSRRCRVCGKYTENWQQWLRMSSVVPPLACRREWLGLSVLAIACVLYAMDLTVLHLAVPQISSDLQPTSVQLLWIIDIYGFFVAGSLITLGNLGDRIGRRRLLLIGAVTFALTSAMAAFSTSAEMLIVSRALLGVSGATIAPSTLSLIRNMFHDQHQRTTAIGSGYRAFRPAQR